MTKSDLGEDLHIAQEVISFLFFLEETIRLPLTGTSIHPYLPFS